MIVLVNRDWNLNQINLSEVITVDLFVPSSSNRSFYNENIIPLVTKTSYLNDEEVNGTEPSPSVRVPCFNLRSACMRDMHLPMYGAVLLVRNTYGAKRV